MIQLTENITYDPSLPLDEQPEVQQFIDECTSTPPARRTEEPAGYWPRPLSMQWETQAAVIEKKYIYQHPANHPENGLCSEEIIIKERS